MRSHEDEPWVNCRTTTRQVATDSLGPVISHGFLEAPGYAPGVLDEAQARFLRRAKLRKLPLSEGFVFEDVVLPSSSEPASALLQAVRGAVAIAGWELPGDLQIRQVRELPRRDGHGAQREWWMSVTQGRHPLRGAYCRLRVATVGEAYGALGCWLPEQAPRSYEPFVVEGAEAEHQAKQAIGFRQGRVLSKSSYELDGGVGRARTAVILYDGKAEWQVEVDGQGSVVSRRRTERGYRFFGLPLDFSDNLQPMDSALDVGPWQTDFLDSAPRLAGAENCVGISLDQPSSSAYQTGMVVCSNGALSEFKPEAKTLLMKPRADGDYTNAPNTVDPLGLHELSVIQVPGLAAVAPGIPVPSVSDNAFQAWRGVKDGKEQIAAARWAELQAFHTIGRRAQFYRFFDHLGTASAEFYGPKFRTEIHVHQVDGLLCSGIGGFPTCATFAGFSGISLGGLNEHPDIVLPKDGAFLFEMAADGSIVSHEFHHHIQFETEWELKGVIIADPDLAAAAEGMADLFGAVAVGRTVTGLLANPQTPDPCANPTNYPFVENSDLIRGACNSNPYPGAVSSDPGERKPYEEGAAVYGAGYAYARRLLETGLGEESALNDLYEAEQVFLAANPINCDTGQPCNLRRMLEGLNFSLLFSDPVSASQATSTPDTPFALRRRRSLALTSFAAKGMNLAQFNITTCNVSLPCQGSTGTPIEVALRTLAVSSAFRWNEGDAIPSFEVFTPTGTQFQQTTLAGNPTTQVTLEFAQEPTFATSASVNVPVPEPINNGPKGYFRFVPTGQQWASLRSAAEATEDRRIYYRARLCLASAPGQCAYSDQGKASQGTTPFLQFGPGAGDSGCTCRQGPGNAASPSWALALLGLAGYAARRRRKA